MGGRLARRYTHQIDNSDSRPGRIIDVGCGPGATVVALAAAFPDAELLGVDLSDPLLEVARAAAAKAGVGERSRFQRADVQRMPYEDDSFDVAINAHVVHLVTDPSSMLNEIERIVRPGGHVFVTDLRRSWLGVLEREIRSAFTLDEAREVFSMSDLREGHWTLGQVCWHFESTPAGRRQ